MDSPISILFLVLLACSLPSWVHGSLGPRFGGSDSSTLVPPPYKTKFHVQPLDHFNFRASGPGSPGITTYKQRYLIADKYWGKPSQPGARGIPHPSELSKKLDGCPGPIFFYTGNESPVTDYYKASGFFTEVLAPKYGALLVFAEHRYFGESMPFGNSSFDLDKIGWDSTDQAMADYAELITALKSQFNAEKCPVVAFGGSYGGMITTWFRLKYPNIVIGGLAASAPLAFYGTGVSPYIFTETATATFNDALSGCGDLVKDGFDAMERAVASSNWSSLNSAFSLCKAISSKEEATNLIGWVQSGLIGMCMLDYPYETDYGIPLPGWPVNKTCAVLDSHSKSSDGSDASRMQALAAGIGTFYNYTGNKHTCYDPSTDVPDWGTCCGWEYLACTDVFLPSGSAGMFPYAKFNLQDSIDACSNEFDVSLNPNWPRIHWGGFDISAGSNIIFSNGLLDPWHTSGVLQNISDSLVAVVIPEAAHHLDLRGPHPQDPIYVREARAQEDAIIGGWLEDYYAQW